MRLACVKYVEGERAMTSAETAGLVVRGCCHVYYALDIGFSVDLKRCAGLIQEAREGSGFQHHARTPPYLNLRPAPVHIVSVWRNTYCVVG